MRSLRSSSTRSTKSTPSTNNKGVPLLDDTKRRNDYRHYLAIRTEIEKLPGVWSGVWGLGLGPGLGLAAWVWLPGSGV